MLCTSLLGLNGGKDDDEIENRELKLKLTKNEFDKKMTSNQIRTSKQTFEVVTRKLGRVILYFGPHYGACTRTHTHTGQNLQAFCFSLVVLFSFCQNAFNLPLVNFAFCSF